VTSLGRSKVVVVRDIRGLEVLPVAAVRGRVPVHRRRAVIRRWAFWELPTATRLLRRQAL